MKSENYQLIESHYNASSEGDLPKMLEDLAPDVSWTEMAGFPYAGTYVGPDAVVEGVLARLGSEWDNYTLKIHQIVDGGDTLVGLGTYSGTYLETGKYFEAEVAHVWTVKDGKIVAFVQYTDTLKVAEAMAKNP